MSHHERHSAIPSQQHPSCLPRIFKALLARDSQNLWQKKSLPPRIHRLRGQIHRCSRSPCNVSAIRTRCLCSASPSSPSCSSRLKRSVSQCRLQSRARSSSRTLTSTGAWTWGTSQGDMLSCSCSWSSMFQNGRVPMPHPSDRSPCAVLPRRSASASAPHRLRLSPSRMCALPGRISPL